MDDVLRELPDDILYDIHNFYYRDLPYLYELKRVVYTILAYEELVEQHGKHWLTQAYWQEDFYEEHTDWVEFYLHAKPMAVLKLILNRDCDDYRAERYFMEELKDHNTYVTNGLENYDITKPASEQKITCYCGCDYELPFHCRRYERPFVCECGLEISSSEYKTHRRSELCAERLKIMYSDDASI